MSEETKINQGGSAYPSLGMSETQSIFDPGMSLRDHFAIQILCAIIRAHPDWGTEHKAERMPVMAYRMADKMIEEKCKQIPS